MKAREFISEAWSQKYKSSINCSHPKGFSQRAHCAGKKKHNESREMEMVCEDCGMCQTHGNLNEIKKGQKDSNGYTRCWPGKHAEGTKTGKNGGQVRNCVPNESIEESEGKRCRQCGMINCKCPGDSCKCKPIAGWIPGKGFKKARDQRVSEDLSRRGFLKGAGAAATMAAAGPEITTLVNGFAEQAGGMNGIQALKAMLKIATPDELYNMYDYYADSGILEDAITDSDMIALDRAGYDNWSEFEEHCDENGVDPDDEFKRLTGQPLKVSRVDDILGQVDDTWSLEDFFDEYPEAMNIINPPRESLLSMRQLANIDTAAKGANLPTPIVAMANAVAGLVRQIFKSNGQPLAAPQQSAVQHARHTPALPAPTRPEFDMTPDLKQKEKVSMQRKGDDEEPEDPSLAPEDPRKLLQRLRDAGAYSRGALQDIIDGTDKSGIMTKERAQELLNKNYGPQKPSSSQNGNQGVAEEASPMIKPPANRFDNKQQAFGYAKEHGGKVFKSTYIDPNTGIKNIIFVVKKEQGMSEGICSLEEAHAIFDDFEQAMAARGLNEDAFDNITDEQIIRETAAWRRSAGKSKKGGLNAKGVASYRREHPGSHLQMAVTTKPSKLKPGSKAAKRRKSFCARMSGVDGPMKKPNGKPTRKALALRKWNC